MMRRSDAQRQFDRATQVIVAGIAAALLPVTAACASTDFSSYNDEDAVVVNAHEARVLENDWERSAPHPEERLVEYRRAALCTAAPDAVIDDGPCEVGAGAITIPTCDDGEPLDPLWRRTRATTTAPWEPWEFVTGWSCPEPDAPTFTADDFRRLPLTPSTLRVQPDRPKVLINVPTITMTDPTPQVLTTTLLGHTVEVRATPTSYTWDYGDGTDRVTTTSPGHPYPDHDVHHTYTDPGTYAITLTTTWTGQYRPAGVATWTPIIGTATTTTSTHPVEAVEAHTHLVAAP